MWADPRGPEAIRLDRLCFSCQVFGVGKLSRFGWSSRFSEFRATKVRVIRTSLQEFITDASIEQIRAWDNSIPLLQREVGEILEEKQGGEEYTAVLEYELPMDLRRPDVIFLLNGSILVIELKGKLAPSQADLDQASAYARDLRCYHRVCERTDVHVVVVPTRAKGFLGVESGVTVLGPDAIDAHVKTLEQSAVAPPIAPEDVSRRECLPSPAHSGGGRKRALSPWGHPAHPPPPAPPSTPAPEVP